MTDRYLVVARGPVEDYVRRLSADAKLHPDGHSAVVLGKVLDAFDALREGRESDFAGRRLGRSPKHFDLRDCAEIKVPIVQEFTRAGRPLGPSHRMIYREFEPPAGDARPVREVVGFGRRANGEVFMETAQNLNRRRGSSVDALKRLPNTEPAVGPNKDPNRPVTPVRLPLPQDVAAALATSVRGSRFPGRPHRARVAPGTCPPPSSAMQRE